MDLKYGSGVITEEIGNGSNHKRLGPIYMNGVAD